MSANAARTVQAVEWGQGVSDAWSSVADFIPKLVVFLVVLLIGWIIAKVVAKLIGTLLPRIGFDRLIHRSGLGRFFQSPNFTPVTLIAKLVYYFILLIALQLALTAFGTANPVSQIVNDIVLWLPQAIVAVVIIVIVAAIASAVRDILSGVLGGLSYGPLLAKIVAGFIIALGVIAALSQVGIALSVTMPVLIAVLATAGGVVVVGVGGGLIAPMRQRWEGWLSQMAADTQAAREQRPAPGQHAPSGQQYQGGQYHGDPYQGGQYPPQGGQPYA